MIIKRDGHDFPSSYRPCRISEVYGQNKEIAGGTLKPLPDSGKPNYAMKDSTTA